MSSHDVKTLIRVDIAEDFTITDAEVVNGKVEEVIKYLDFHLPLKACRCGGDKICINSDQSAASGELINQNDELKICVGFYDNGGTAALPPAYVNIVDIMSFSCTLEGSTLNHMPIDNFQFAGDGLTSVEIDNSDPSIVQGRMLIVSTLLPSEFFGRESRAVLCSGVIRYEFTPSDNIFDNQRRDRVLAESSLPSIGLVSKRTSAESTKDTGAVVVAESDSEFSVEVELAGEFDTKTRTTFHNKLGRGILLGTLATISAIAMLIVVRPGGCSDFKRRFVKTGDTAEWFVGRKIASSECGNKMLMN